MLFETSRNFERRAAGEKGKQRGEGDEWVWVKGEGKGEGKV